MPRSGLRQLILPVAASFWRQSQCSRSPSARSVRASPKVLAKFVMALKRPMRRAKGWSIDFRASLPVDGLPFCVGGRAKPRPSSAHALCSELCQLTLSLRSSGICLILALRARYSSGRGSKRWESISRIRRSFSSRTSST